MKANVGMWVVLTVFFALITTLYITWWFLTYGGWDPVGTSVLAMLTFMSVFLTFYLWKTDRTQGLVPEDRLDANIEDGEAEMGFFAPWSWWPMMLGLGGAICFTSLAVGWWMFAIGLPLSFLALIGFVFEHSRGQHAH
jgi:hypothetical protein